LFGSDDDDISADAAPSVEEEPEAEEIPAESVESEERQQSNDV